MADAAPAPGHVMRRRTEVPSGSAVDNRFVHRWLTGGLVAAVCWWGGGTVAHAEPVIPGIDCTYDLTPPHVVSVSGVPMVAVEVNPRTCVGLASPNFASACVSRTGDDDNGRCASITGYRAVQVLYPYEPGRTYIARGRGCAAVYEPMTQVCETVGPISAQL